MKSWIERLVISAQPRLNRFYLTMTTKVKHMKRLFHKGASLRILDSILCDYECGCEHLPTIRKWLVSQAPGEWEGRYHKYKELVAFIDFLQFNGNSYERRRCCLKLLESLDLTHEVGRRIYSEALQLYVGGVTSRNILAM